MKRICYISIPLCIALLHIEAQVQVVPWSKAATNDTAKTAWGPNLGILAKFVTFPDGTKMLTAAGFSDTTKYIEKVDSLAMPGYATRTMLGKDSTYARAIFALDTTYKAAQLLLRIKYADSTNSPGYVTRTQFRADSLYARAIFALDTTYKAAQLLTRIPYSDTTSSLVKQWIFIRDSLYRAAQEDAIRLDTVYARAIFALDTTYKAAELLKRILYSDTTNSLTMRWVFVRDSLYRAAEEAKRILYSDTTSSVAMQWELDGKIAKSDTSAFPSIVPARDGQFGWFKRNATAPESGTLTANTSTDSLIMSRILVNNKFAFGSLFSAAQLAIVLGDNTFISGGAPMIKAIGYALQIAGDGGIALGTTSAEFMRLHTNGNLGLGSATPLHKVTAVSSIATNLNAFNFTDSNINTVRTTVAQATDTSSVNLGFTSTGEPIFSLIGKTGTVNFRSDSSGAIFNGLVDFQGTNSATVTAGAGDSIQVSVTGVTITSQIVATYAATTALTDVSTGIRNKQTGKFTIQATNGKDVTYWISKK